MILSINLGELKSMAQAERVVILLPNEVKKQLKQKADEKNLSMSTYVKLLVTEDLRNEKK
ncbi:hypothetical protein CEE67_09550 [Limosilactobacillus fermentum]|nr:hypothetical protein CEE67_09550 [Limosilactobacillus fermentum]